MISLYSIPPALGAALSFYLGFFVWTKHKSSSMHRYFFLLCFSMFIWLAAYAIAYSTESVALAVACAKAACTSVAFVTLFIYHFVVVFLDLKTETKYLKIIYVATIGFLVGFVFTNIFLNGVHNYFWGFYSKAGILHPLYLIITYLTLLRCFYLLFKHRSGNGSEIKRGQIKYLLIAFVLVTPATIDYIPKYGFEIYPFGFIFVLIFSLVTGYAIIKHQLLDIEVIIRRTAVFAGLFAFVYGAFTVVTILGNQFFKDTLGWNQWVAMIPTVFIITFALRPLEIFLTNITERFLFQKKYDYKELLKVFTNEILTVLDLQELTNRTVIGLNNIIKLESASVLLHDRELKNYKVVAAFGLKNRDLIFKEDDTLISYINAMHEPIQRDKHSDKLEGHSALREDFTLLNARLCLPLVLHDELLGVLTLGMKKSGEDYTDEDIDILMTLARTEAIAISNARLFDELSKTQAEAAQREKMAVIGTLAAGINHEICNPLGIVRGQCEMFLLNFKDGFYKDKSPEEMTKIFTEIMSKVIKETDRATAITKKLSGFAKPSKRADFEEVSVEREVEEVLGLIGHEMKLNNIDVQRHFPSGLPHIFADKKQIEEVLFNIIRNAAQAIDKKQGLITVSGHAESESVVVKIIDNGMGIPQAKLGEIFHPFYTTKAPGKGTGLGLFIVKQVVERNNGSIQVESEPGAGTTFTLKFPIAKAALAA